MRYLRRYGAIVLQINGKSAGELGEPYGDYEYFIRHLSNEFERHNSPTWYTSIKWVVRDAMDAYRIYKPRCRERQLEKANRRKSKWDMNAHQKVLRKGCNYPRTY